MKHAHPMYPWQKPARAALNQAIDASQLGHAPMFLGPPGVGKRSLARWLAARLLCQDVGDGESCGKCHSCQLLGSGSHPDFFDLAVLEDKTEIVVDQVRGFI
ncbi:MAG: hypothetical protein LC637_06260, partial [Xanthomonadaceae bacterium]|nr:hypothetical protein [Xanthomonadaceae bacterium]